MKSSLVLLATLVVASGALAQTLPDAAEIRRPSSNPALPAEFAPFAPPVDASPPPVGAPATAEMNRMLRPGDTAIVAHEGATGGVFYAQTATTSLRATAPVRTAASARTLLLETPSALPNSAAMLFWPTNVAGAGRPTRINMAELQWLSRDTVRAGESLELYGRNLVGERGRANVYLQRVGGSGFWRTPVEANPYRAAVSLPAALGPGTYEAWSHNGRGGAYGWSGPVRFTVTAPRVWSGPVYDVTTFGATPNDETDDEAAIQAAFDAAGRASFATVRFPAGTFLASRGFACPPNTRVQGAGMDLTRLACHKDFVATDVYDGRRYCLVFSGGNGQLWQDLTLDTNGNANGYLDCLGHQRFLFDLTYERVRFAARGYGGFDWHGCTSVVVRDCEMTSAGGSFLGSGDQMTFERTRFFGTNDANQLVSTFGGGRFAFHRCRAADLDATREDGWAQGRFVVFQSHWGPVTDVYFGENETKNLGPRPGFWNQNTGEQVLMEVGQSGFRGSPTFAASRTLRFPSLPDLGNQGVIVVVSGPGQGQVRRVTSYDVTRRQVVINRPWNVVPTRDSVLSFGNFGDNVAVYGNRFEGKAAHVDQADHVATTAVYWQGTQNVAIDSNRLKDMRAAFSSFGVASGDSAYPLGVFVNAWADVVRNTTDHCGALASVVGDWSNPTTQDRGFSTYAHAWRSNTLTNSGTGFYQNDHWNSPGQPILANVVERNRFFTRDLRYVDGRDGRWTFRPDEILWRANVWRP